MIVKLKEAEWGRSWGQYSFENVDWDEKNDVCNPFPKHMKSQGGDLSTCLYPPISPLRDFEHIQLNYNIRDKLIFITINHASFFSIVLFYLFLTRIFAILPNFIIQ